MISGLIDLRDNSAAMSFILNDEKDWVDGGELEEIYPQIYEVFKKHLSYIVDLNDRFIVIDDPVLALTIENRFVVEEYFKRVLGNRSIYINPSRVRRHQLPINYLVVQVQVVEKIEEYDFALYYDVWVFIKDPGLTFIHHGSS